MLTKVKPARPLIPDANACSAPARIVQEVVYCSSSTVLLPDAGPLNVMGSVLNESKPDITRSISSSQFVKPLYARPTCACQGIVIDVVAPCETSLPPGVRNCGVSSASTGVPAGRPSGLPPASVRPVAT